MNLISDRIKNHRKKVGLSQEQLAEQSGLNIRTIQRIENGDTIPRGDSLRRLAMALKKSPDELIDWSTKDDHNILVIITISQFAFIAFPLLGILVPMAIWILQKDRVQKVNALGKNILNFQMTWALAFFSVVSLFFLQSYLHVRLLIVPDTDSRFPMVWFIRTMYLLNIGVITYNTIQIIRKKSEFYMPAFRILK